MYNKLIRIIIHIPNSIYNLCSHGTTKVVAGLGLLGLGALTGNQDVTNLGSAVTTLGIGTKVAAHLFG